MLKYLLLALLKSLPKSHLSRSPHRHYIYGVVYSDKDSNVVNKDQLIRVIFHRTITKLVYIIKVYISLVYICSNFKKNGVICL